MVSGANRQPDSPKWHIIIGQFALFRCKFRVSLLFLFLCRYHDVISFFVLGSYQHVQKMNKTLLTLKLDYNNTSEKGSLLLQKV